MEYLEVNGDRFELVHREDLPKIHASDFIFTNGISSVKFRIDHRTTATKRELRARCKILLMAELDRQKKNGQQQRSVPPDSRAPNG